MSSPIRSALFAAVLLAAGAAAGQTDHSVYPVYEGYVANADGSFTLVFGYFNASPVAVTLATGDENGFDPGPADRGQPTTFLPGRQRNICRMVVGAGDTGNLRWTLGAGERRQSTSEKGGPNPLYLLEEISSGYRAASELDPASVPRGVCINDDPTVRAPASVEAVAGEAVELRALVSDDGLPRDHPLEISWVALDSPESVRFANPSGSTTHATFASAGTYVVAVQANDGEAASEARVTVNVRAAGASR